MKALFLIGVMLVDFPVIGLGQNVDSLTNAYYDFLDDDTKSYETLFHLVSGYVKLGDWDSTRKYGYEGVRLGAKLNHGDCEEIFYRRTFLHELGKSYFQVGLLDSAIKYSYMKADLVCSCEVNPRVCMNTYLNIFQVLVRQGKLTPADSIINEAMMLAKEHQDTLYQIKLGVSEVSTQVMSLDYKKALEGCLRLKRLYEEIDESGMHKVDLKNLENDRLALLSNELMSKIGLLFPPDLILPLHGEIIIKNAQLQGKGSINEVAVFNMLGSYFYTKSDFRRSEESFLQAIEIGEKYPLNSYLMESWMGLGTLYLRIDSFAKATTYTDLILQNSDSSNATRTNLMAQSLKCGIELQGESDVELIRKKLDRIGVLAEIIGDPFVFWNVENMKAEAFKVQKNYSAALELFAKLQTVGEQAQNWDMILNSRKNKLRVYEEAGWFDKAYQELTEITAIEDSINSIRNEAIMLDYEAKLGVQKIQADKEKADLAFQQEKESKRRLALITAVVALALIIVLILALSLYRSQQKRKKTILALQSANVQLEEKSAHIATLNKEVHHRVKNNLQMLANLINLQAHQHGEGPAKKALGSAKGRIDAISRLHQLLYSDDDVTTIHLAEFVRPLVRQIREAAHIPQDAVDIHTDIVPKAIDVDTAIPLAVILNEWLTNSFKYAVGLVDSPQIFISLTAIGNDQLVLKYADNGPGFDPASTPADSYGMRLVDSMVMQIRGQLDAHHASGVRYTLTFRQI